MFAIADEYRAGLKLLAQQQRGRLTSLIEQTERTLHTDWQHARDIVMRYYAPIIDRYAKDLAALRAEAAAAGEDGAGSMALDLSWLTDQNPQLASIQQSVSAAFNSYGNSAAAAVSDAQAQAVDAGAEDAAALTQRALWPAVEGAGVPPGMLFDRPLPEALSQWINRASNGLQIAQLFDGFGDQAAREVRQAMMLGLAMGENPRAMSSAISNALGISRSRATIIGRTEALSAYRSAQHEIYRANSDVLGGWLWSAGGPNPCAACMGMDGLQFSLEEELIDHPCGACSPLPVTRSWDDILGPLGIDTSDMEETSLGADGAYLGGEDRLLQMSPEQQRAVFGTKTGYEAWQRGEVSLRDFAGIRSGGGYDGMLYQKSLRELQIPTRQASRLVEPNPELLAKLRAGRLRGTDLGRVTPEDAMPAWAKQSEASRIVYQILRNGLPYDLMSHEQGLLITNLQEMLRGELPVNVRAAVERQLIALGQPVERETIGTAARDALENITRAYAPARGAGAVPDAEAAARLEVRSARTQLNGLNRKLERALASGKPTETLTADIAKAREALERAQARLDVQVTARKAAAAEAKAAAKAQAAADRAAAREAAKAAKLAEKQAARDAVAAFHGPLPPDVQDALRAAVARGDLPASYGRYSTFEQLARTGKGVAWLNARDVRAVEVGEVGEASPPFTVEQFLEAHRQRLPRELTGTNDAYMTTINGQKYLIKDVSSNARADEVAIYRARAEAAATQIAQIAGLGDEVPRAYFFAADGRQYVASEFIDNAKTMEQIRSTVIKYASENDLRNATLQEYLVGDTDRNMGNYLFNVETNRLYTFDHGEALTNSGAEAWQGGKQTQASRIWQTKQGVTYADSLRSTLGYERMVYDPAQLRAIVAQEPQILAVMRANGLTEGIPSLEARLDVLRQLSQMEHPTYADLYLLGNGEEVEVVKTATASEDLAQAASRATTAEAEQTASQEALDALAAAQAQVDTLRQEWEAARMANRYAALPRGTDGALHDLAIAQARVDAEMGGRGAVIISHDLDDPFAAEARTDQYAEQFFGRPLTRDELGGLVGAPEGTNVHIYSADDGMIITMNGDGFNASRTLELTSRGNLVMENTTFFIDSEHQAQGLGASIFADQAQTLSDLGVKRIETFAAGDGPGVLGVNAEGNNGYYTWARLGYTGRLSDLMQQKLTDAVAAGEVPQAWANYTTVQQLMRTEDGRAWWKAYGEGMAMQFDLAPDSYSMRTLRAYLAEKGAR